MNMVYVSIYLCEILEHIYLRITPRCGRPASGYFSRPVSASLGCVATHNTKLKIDEVRGARKK